MKEGTGLEVVFLGSPRFAVPILESVARSNHVVVLVVTQPDRPAGRGLRPRPTAVKAAAEVLSIAVETISAADRDGLANLLLGVAPDVIVTAAWAGLLTRRSLAAARIAALNVHPSMLPRYRGAAPIERAMMAGEKSFGVTVMHLSRELDAGDIVLQEPVSVAPDLDGGQVSDLHARAGGGLLVRALDLLAAGTAPRVPQDARNATWAPKLTPEDERITWEMPAEEIVNRFRALSPRPGAYFLFGGQRVKITGARVWDGGTERPRSFRLEDAGPGTVLGRDADSLAIAAGGATAIILSRVKPAGRREISGADFANGRRLSAGDVMSDEGA